VYKIVGSPVFRAAKMRNARMYVVNLIMKFYEGAGSFKSDARVGC